MTDTSKDDLVKRLRLYLSFYHRKGDPAPQVTSPSLILIGEAADALERMERELAAAQKNYQFMVDRATNEKLDGYRELGAKAAAAEERAEKAERELAEARDGALEEALAIVRGEKAAWNEPSNVAYTVCENIAEGIALLKG
jgi:hypothetical protein